MAIQIGTLPEQYTGFRDAAHQPVQVAVSLYTLNPGEMVVFDFNGYVIPVERNEPYQGIVDPFLSEPVPPDTKVLVLLHPNLVKNVRHAFDVDTSVVVQSTSPTEEVPVEDDYSDDDDFCSRIGC